MAIIYSLDLPSNVAVIVCNKAEKVYTLPCTYLTLQIALKTTFNQFFLCAIIQPVKVE